MPPFLIFIFLFLLSRFLFLSEGHPLSVMRWGVKCLVDVAVLLVVFGISPESLFFCLTTLVANTAILLSEVFEKGANPRTRSLSLIVVILLATILMDRLLVYGVIPTNWLNMGPAMLALICSVLLCLKESNFLIRWFFEHNRLIEKIEEADSKTENGRIIGNLERVLLIFFLWQGAAVAATFIVAIKGLARFKKMEEEQAFAEYVIIGTFLSVLITLVIFQLTRFWIGAPGVTLSL
ncbi:MAG: hypothetical protein AAGH40_13125 [Verrucomicrobiota bacterium]